MLLGLAIEDNGLKVLLLRIIIFPVLTKLTFEPLVVLESELQLSQFLQDMGMVILQDSIPLKFMSQPIDLGGQLGELVLPLPQQRQVVELVLLQGRDNLLKLHQHLRHLK